MCGIVGYLGFRDATDFLVEGLRRLEYRGYDSAGVATLNSRRSFSLVKTTQRIDSLAELLEETPAAGAMGIGHTRWATHGPPSAVNAHPHLGGDQEVVIAHNGVIENYQVIKQRLESEGFQFRSATDSEVVAHAIAAELRKLRAGAPKAAGGEAGVRRAGGHKNAANKAAAQQTAAEHEMLAAAVAQAVSQFRGTYGLVVLFRDFPDVMIAARLGSPLVVGIGEGEHFVASDSSPLAGYTDKIVYLADHQIAIITKNTLSVAHRGQGRVKHNVEVLPVDEEDAGMNGFPHYMLKEIFEQPESLQNTMRGRLNEEDGTAVFGGFNLTRQQLRNVDRLLLTACGTSWHAAHVGDYVIEEMSRIPVEVEYASELRYRNPPINGATLLFALSQSGETADTLGALREMKRKGHPTLAICNTVGSTIAQEADGGVYLHAGPEIGVASTKAYTSQCLVLTLLGLFFGRLNHLSYDAGRRIIDDLYALPDQVRRALDTAEQVRDIAEKYCGANNFLYLGRQVNFPTALEGALKLKEISYVHAEGYPAAEMKHGPIALVDENTPSVFIVPQGYVYEKVMANMEEIKARGGPIIAIVEEGDTRAAAVADDVIHIPRAPEYLQPIVSVAPLQLLAYHIAVLRGCDVDKPRNLAKSVTVE